MELQPLKVRFYPKKRSLDSTTYTLYMRMVLRGRRTDLSLNYEIGKEDWDEKNQTLRPKHPERGFVLNLTNKYRQKAMEVYQQLIQRGMAYDVNIIRQKVTGTEKDEMAMEPTLMRLFNRALERKKVLKGPNNHPSGKNTEIDHLISLEIDHPFSHQIDHPFLLQTDHPLAGR